MPCYRIAAALLWLLTLDATARACDSYQDDMALASVLARAVAEARAEGTLPRLATAAPTPAAPGLLARGLGGPVEPSTGPRQQPIPPPEVSFLP
jgi:hypothetical protein